MSSKGSERRGPWHHAAVAALQGASIEEQLQYLDPDLVHTEELPLIVVGPGLGLGQLGGAPERAAVVAAPDDSAANREANRVWSRWDVHARGRVVRR